MAGILFEDIFDVKDIDPEGKKFDRGECSHVCVVIVLLQPVRSLLPCLFFCLTRLHAVTNLLGDDAG